MHPALQENKSRILPAVLRGRREPLIESISQGGSEALVWK